MTNYLVLGSGGHALTVRDLVCEKTDSQVVAFVEPPEYFYRKGQKLEVDEIPIWSQDAVDISLDWKIAVGVGFIRDPSVRIALYDWASKAGLTTPSLVSRFALMSPSVQVGDGAQVLKGALVGPHVKIGLGAIINHGAQLEHGTLVGEFSHISTGAIVNGDVQIGERVFIGSGAVVKNGVTIRDDSFIPMGAKITKDVL